MDILCSHDELCWHLHQIYFDRIEGPDKSPFFGHGRFGRLAILMRRLLSQGFLTRAAAARAPHHPLDGSGKSSIEARIIGREGNDWIGHGNGEQRASHATYVQVAG